MNPKKYKNFYQDIAEEAEVHKNLVSDFVFFFYAKLKKAIKRQKDILGNLQKMTFDGFDKSIPVNEKIKQMEKLLNKIEINIKQKKKFKNENK